MQDETQRAASLGQYQAFLLRLWRDSPEAEWRLSLEDTRTGMKIGFADGSRLLAYLDATMQLGQGVIDKESSTQRRK